MQNKPEESAEVRTMLGDHVTVTGRPIRTGNQLAPEVVITGAGRAEILHLTPENARALSDALRDAADCADGLR